jgi:hypothetical protein
MRLSHGGFTAEPVQRSCPVESFGLTTSVAEVAMDGQGLLQVPGRTLVITRQPQDVPQVGEGAGLAGLVAEVAADWRAVVWRVLASVQGRRAAGARRARRSGRSPGRAGRYE